MDKTEWSREHYRKHKDRLYWEKREEKIEKQKVWARNNPDKRRASSWKQQGIDITFGQFLTLYYMLRKCEICGRVFSKFGEACVDHDHTNGKVKGLLCRKCNTFEGWYQLYKNEVRKYAE